MSDTKKLFVFCLTLALVLCFTGCNVYLSDLNSQEQETHNTQSTDSVSSGTLSEETLGEDVIDDEEFQNPDITIDFETGSVTANSQSSKKPNSSSSAQSGSSATQSTTSDESKDSMDGGWTPWA